MADGFDKEKIRKLAKQLKEKGFFVSIVFQTKLYKALELPGFFSLEDIKLMREEVESRFTFAWIADEIYSFLDSMKEVLKKKTLIL